MENTVQTNKSLTIGIQGGMGSFNEQATLHHLAVNQVTDYEVHYLYTTEKLLASLSNGTVDLGLFAIHNSVGGIVHESIKAMGRYNFQIQDEVVIPIRHFLMKLPDSQTEEIRRIMAHPQVFAQCRTTLHQRYPKLDKESGQGDLIDTARAAQALRNGEIPNHTVILGPQRLAELYNFEIIDQDLQDDHPNNTSFLLVRK